MDWGQLYCECNMLVAGPCIDHFTVVDLVPQPSSECESDGDLVLIQTSFALLWKLSLKNTGQHKNNLIYIIKQEGLYQDKVTVSLASIHNCKMDYCRNDEILERLRFTFTPNGKREFVPRDQVFPLVFVYCLLLLYKNKQFYASFIHKNRSGLFLSAYFLF